VSATGCATDPDTITDDLTWFVEGTSFTAQSPIPILTFSADGFYYYTFTFPEMTVTSLTRGEQITLVQLRQDSANERLIKVEMPMARNSSDCTSRLTSATLSRSQQYFTLRPAPQLVHHHRFNPRISVLIPSLQPVLSCPQQPPQFPQLLPQFLRVLQSAGLLLVPLSELQSLPQLWFLGVI